MLLQWSASTIQGFLNETFPLIIQKCTFTIALPKEIQNEFFTRSLTNNNETNYFLDIGIYTSDILDFQQATLSMNIDSALFNMFSGQSKKVI